MPLTLPADRAVLTDSEVLGVIADYRRVNPAVIDLFDLTNRGPHDEIEAIDILSLNALNAYSYRAGRMTPMSNMWERRSQVQVKISAITRTPVEQLADAEVENELRKIQAALGEISSVSGFGGFSTTAYKFLHRMRPNIAPIWDREVGEWYPTRRGNISGYTYPSRVLADVRSAGNLVCIQAVRKQLDVDLTLVRIWDIILWRLAKTGFLAALGNA